MGRGRQKAKQRRNARKLKYLTTDTDYEELQRELSGQEAGPDESDQKPDPFGQIDEKFQREREMDEYAKWAEEAAAKAKKQPQAATPKPRKIPAGLFASMMKPHAPAGSGATDETDSTGKAEVAQKATKAAPVLKTAKTTKTAEKASPKPAARKRTVKSARPASKSTRSAESGKPSTAA